MQDPKVVFYSSLDLLYTQYSDSFSKNQFRPGMTMLRTMTRFWASSFVVIDRTGTTTNPINSYTLPHLELPEFKAQNLDLDELCCQRARELLKKAEKTQRRLAILYSGGVDSTLILVTLLKVATQEQLDQYVTVFLSEVSRSENPSFYDQYLLKHYKNLVSSYAFHNYLGNPGYIVVTGEGCDQMFGSSIFLELTRDRGNNIINAPATDSTIKEIIAQGTNAGNSIDAQQTEKIYEYYRPIIAAAPRGIHTVYEYFWWLNFILKWQSVYVRLSSYTLPQYRSTLKYEDNYTMFFGTDLFQLWAMNNQENLIKDDWASYKYVCKDIIKEYTGDEDWALRKLKFGSLINILKNKHQSRLIDDSSNFYDDYPDWAFNASNTMGDLENQTP